MSLWIQIKYLKYLPLEQFTDKGGQKWNFRCPVCGDSQQSATKKRGWARPHKNNLKIKCFNCDYSNSLQYFIKDHFPNFYSDYIKEIFDNSSYTPVKQSNVDLFATEYDNLNLLQIKDLPITHKASLYLRRRKLPENIIDNLYYSDNFSKWLNTEIEVGAINYQADQDRRIVIPFYNKYKKIFAMQGRTIDYADPKVITHKTDKECDLVFGLDNVDFTKTVYVCEGAFDSVFIPNCIAVSGAMANLKNILKYTHKDNIVIVPDNDFRNKYTDKFVSRFISQGYNIVIWDKKTPFKDINDGIIKGLTSDEIFAIIQEKTVKGLMAEAKFKLKRL